MTTPQPPAPTPTPGTPARATLSRDLGEFLIEFSIALNKFAMYPGGHPSLGPAVEQLVRRLDQLLAERGTLSVGVARQQLVIEGVATDNHNPVLKDLAGRLHRHHLGAITFSKGVEVDELLEFVNKVAIEADRSEQPLGLMIQRLVAWRHIRMYPLMYDRLELLDETGQEQAKSDDPAARSQRTRAAQLWVGMARAALAAGDGASVRALDAQHGSGKGDEDDPGNAREKSDVPTDPASIARAIENQPRGTAYDQVIVGYMLQIADELRSAGGGEAVHLKKRMERLITNLDQKTLGRLMEMGGDGMQRRQFLMSASQGMAAESVLDLVTAASNTQEQTISHSMLRMLQKLANHADSGGGARQAEADKSVRDQISQMIRGWSLKDPNPEAYQKALESLSQSGSVFAVSPEAKYAPEPRRIVQMALEVNAEGEPLERAVKTLAESHQLAWLIETLNAAGRSSVASDIWRQIATPEHLASVLRAEPLETGLVEAILPMLGISAAGVLLDALIEVQSAQTRRFLLDRIIGLGFEVGPAAMARLVDERWYVKRNMLKIISDLEIIPPDLKASEYLQNDDARVRREAFRIVLRDPALRERAVCRALGDPDAQMVRAGLAAALQQFPPAALPLVASRALSGANEELRVMAIRVLGACRIRTAVDALLRITAPRKSLFGSRAPTKTPEYLAAIAALRSFADDGRVRDILDQASRSPDPEIAQAALGAPST